MTKEATQAGDYEQQVQRLKRNLFDCQEAAKDLAQQATKAERERDALAAKLKELEGLAKAATPGPWKLVGTVEQDGGTYRDIIPTSVSCGGWCQGGTPDRADECDLQYISAANPFSVLSLIDSLRKAKMRVQILERNLRDAEESGRRLAKQAHRAEQERDALAARLAELEGQEPVAWVYDWQAPEGLIKGWVETNRDAIPEDATNIRPLYARPVPAEPVNARLLDVAVWPAGYCRDPNGKMSIPAGKEEDFNFGYDVGFQEAWEILNSAISAAGKSPTSQQERLLQDMHDAGREIDRMMAEAAPKAVRLTDYSSTVDRAWARFCGAFGDGPDASYPGMIAAFETHYGQSFRDKEWRTEAACWAAAWSKATARADSSVWVLTSSCNDYDQHGEYFEAVFKDKPTRESIMEACGVTEEGADHILLGGGRKGDEYMWFNLRQEALP